MTTPTFGLLSTGLVTKALQDCKSELDAAYKAGPLGSSAGTEPDGSIPPASLAGQLIAIDTDRDAGLWDLTQTVYKSFDPQSATDEAQDSLCALTGTLREAAEASTVTGVCTGTLNTIIPLGSVATVAVSGTRFATLAQVTISTQTPWAINHGYSLGDRCWNDSPAKVYQCITAGQSAGSGGPTGTDADITDNAAHWCYLGDGDSYVDAPFEAEQTGKLYATAWTLTNIATPLSGWSSVNNPLDATLGAVREVNSALRLRREAELAGDGGGIADGIRAKILKIAEGTGDQVRIPTSCRVFGNDDDITDVNGLPPHSVMVLVGGGVDQEIANTLWLAVGGGIATYGSTTETVVDSAGNNQSVSFSHPTDANIYIDIALTYDPNVWPATGGEAMVALALKTYGDTYDVGKSVRASLLEAAAIDGPAGLQDDGTPNAATPGILDVKHLFIIRDTPPVIASTTILIATTERAKFDTAWITVTATQDPIT